MKIHSRHPVADAEAMVKKYGNMVYKLAFSQVHNKSDADDIFQEVFCAISKIPRNSKARSTKKRGSYE